MGMALRSELLEENRSVAKRPSQEAGLSKRKGDKRRTGAVLYGGLVKGIISEADGGSLKKN